MANIHEKGPLHHLQRIWSLEDISIKGREEVTVKLYTYEVEGPNPEVLGRHVSDIYSWPSCIRLTAQATFTFTGVHEVRFADVYVSDEVVEGERYDGTSFRRYFNSALLRRHQEANPVYLPSHFKHYCFVFMDEFIDIICAEAPGIALREGAVIRN
jgi:hypothetical protein